MRCLTEIRFGLLRKWDPINASVCVGLSFNFVVKDLCFILKGDGDDVEMEFVTILC